MGAEGAHLDLTLDGGGLTCAVCNYYPMSGYHFQGHDPTRADTLLESPGLGGWGQTLWLEGGTAWPVKALAQCWDAAKGHVFWFYP
jgi:hypothetical protein